MSSFVPLRSLAAAVLLVLLACPAHAQPQAARVIVKFRSGSELMSAQSAASSSVHVARAQALGARVGIALSAGATVSEQTQVVTATGLSGTELAARIAAQPDVEYAVPERRKRAMVAPNDPFYSAGGANGPPAGQWYLRAPTADLLAGIDAESAWSVTTGSASVVVAMVDTGVRFDHPDLLRVANAGNLLPGYDMVSDPQVANDGDGRDGDPSDPGDWVTAAEVNDPSSTFYHCTDKDPATGKYVAEDSGWHGTQTAGLVGANTNNGIGIASVGRTVRVLPVRALGKCFGTDSDIIAAMRWAAGLAVPGVPANPTPARVINLSLGGDNACSAAYQDAVNEIVARGVVIVASAGNSSAAVNEPANCAGVIGVVGLRHVGTKVAFSSLGPEATIAAPGGNCGSLSGPCLYPIMSTTNSGTTTPLAPDYTDAYNSSVGTSFSAPLVSGTVALMLSVQPSLTPSDVRLLLQATARMFPTASADAATGAPVAQCVAPTVDASGNAVEQQECVCTGLTCGAGMLDAGAAVAAAATGFPATGLSAQGLWWNAPAGSESGWGLFLAHQGDVIFAAWYTYDPSGRPLWLTMAASRTGANVYTGTLYRSSGPTYASASFDPTLVTRTPVGSATIAFTNASYATFSYTYGGVTQTKRITRQLFGAAPTCTWGGAVNVALATNYQDLWWNWPGESESGWGLALTEQGGTVFAAWYTYDLDGSPLWLTAVLNPTGPSSFAGSLVRTLGPWFAAVPFLPAAVTRTAVGDATLSFTDGDRGTFSYTLNGVTRVKPITRQVFAPPGTVCQ